MAASWQAPLVDAAALAPMIVPARTALLVIDVQCDFAAESGKLGRAGVDMAPLWPAQANLERLLPAARAAGASVVLARLVTRAETDGVALRQLYRRQGQNEDALALCRAGTAGADYHRIRAEPGDIEVEKPLYSCFHGTGLGARLRVRGVDTLVVCGFTSECCVEASVRSAFERDFHVFVVADACASYEVELHLNALRSLSLHYGLLVESEAVLRCWQF